MHLARDLIGIQKDAGSMSALFSLASFVDDRTFVTKQGNLGCALQLRGISAEGLTADSLDIVGCRLRSALRMLDENYRIYQYALKRSCDEIPTNLPDGIVADTLRHRKKFLDEKAKKSHLFTVELYWVILYEPPKAQAAAWRSLGSRGITRIYETQLRRDLGKIRHKADMLSSTLADILAPRVLPANDAFHVHRKLANLDFQQASIGTLPENATYVDHLVCDLPIEWGRDGLKVGENHVEALTLRDCQKTEPNLFSEVLQIPCDFVLATEYKGIDRLEAQKRVANAQTHFETGKTFRNIWSLVVKVGTQFMGGDPDKAVIADAGATKNVEELDQLAIALNQGDELGEFSVTLLLYGKNKALLQDSAAEAARAFSKFDASLIRETANTFNCYLAVQPGNSAFSFRRLQLLHSSVADMALTYQRDQGQLTNDHLGGDYLIACETEDATPHFLNLHHEGVFGIFISGKTGSGKSTLSNAFLDHLQKYDPITLVLDVGNSYRNLCAKYDGAYLSINDLDFHANPFGLEDSPRTRRFLSAFVKMLLENEGYKPNYHDTRKVFEKVCELMTKDRDHRRLRNLDLGEKLTAPLYRWIGNGEFGTVFDNIEDDVSFTHFKVFDFAGIEDAPEVAEPLFFYLFMRHERMVQDPATLTRFKVLWADEAWRFLANETCRRQFVRAGKTYRKHNAGIALATQSAFDLQNVGLFEVISEVCPTKILLANPSADLAAYQKFYHLNEQELEQFRNLIGKRQFLLKKEEQPAQVLNLRLSPYELVQYGNDPYGNARRDAAIAKHGQQKGLQILAEEIEEELKAC